MDASLISNNARQLIPPLLLLPTMPPLVSHNQPVERYGISRRPASQPKHLTKLLTLINIPAEASAAELAGLFQHYQLDRTGDPKFACHYSVAPSVGVYIVTKIDVGRSRMKRRDIIADNWKKATAAAAASTAAAGTAGAEGGLAGLKYIAYNMITNEKMQEVMYNALQESRALGQGEPALTFVEGWQVWATVSRENIFLNGLNKMLQEYAMEFGGARVESVRMHNKDSADQMVFTLSREAPVAVAGAGDAWFWG
ncbi:hypothetical protein F4778DRAFT_791468 [Xylariomycetidae sp. FL2044]|nr:hypothetical protein F4778DRAFT_791468 [Xylariomycetidae sp. FL2044]